MTYDALTDGWIFDITSCLRSSLYEYIPLRFALFKKNDITVLNKKKEKKKKKNDITILIKKRENDITVALVICCLTRITCSHEGVLLGAVVIEKED